MWDLYKNFHLNDIPGANPLGRLDRKPNLFEYRVNGGSLMSRKNPGALEVSGKRFMMDLPRFYLDYHKGPLHVRMGNQQIAWGQSLFFRVMDVPNGLDLRRHSLLDYVPEEFSDKRVPSPCGARSVHGRQLGTRWIRPALQADHLRQPQYAVQRDRIPVHGS